MSSLLNPIVPIPLEPVEIDQTIEEINALLITNLTWLSNAYGRAYRKIEKTEKETLYLPEIYVGVRKTKKDYYRVTPDGSK